VKVTNLSDITIVKDIVYIYIYICKREKMNKNYFKLDEQNNC